MVLVIIALVLLLAGYFFYFNGANTESPYTKLLSGIWRAPKTYLIESDTELISLYIESDLRDAWIIIKKEDNFILNDPIGIDFKEISANAKMIKYDATFDGIDSTDFPNKQKAIFYPDCCKMILYSGDRIYAVLYKDCELTESVMENHFDVKVDENSLVEPVLVEEEDMGESLENDTEEL